MSSKISTVVLSFWFLLSSTLILQAHEDVVIALKGTGLQGLPDRFQPATLDVRNSYLRLANKQLTFNPFVKEIFSDKRPYKVEITASWYHDRSILPPYLCVNVTPKGTTFTYHLLINLESAEVIKAEVALHESKSRTRFIPIDSACWKEGRRGGTVETLK